MDTFFPPHGLSRESQCSLEVTYWAILQEEANTRTCSIEFTAIREKKTKARSFLKILGTKHTKKNIIQIIPNSTMWETKRIYQPYIF